jgi:hypothetical protein
MTITKQLSTIIMYELAFQQFYATIDPNWTKELIEIHNCRSQQLSELKDEFLRIYGITWSEYAVQLTHFN